MSQRNIQEREKALPLFSVSQYTTFPLSFEEDVKLYTELGIEAIEVCEEKLSADVVQAREQLAMLKDSGLRVTSVQPCVHSPFPHNGTVPDDPQSSKDRMARFRRTIDLFSECFPGENIPLVTGGGIAPDYNFRLAHRTAREWFPELADYAAERGLRLAFEHLNPILMNAFTFICTLDETVQLAKDIERPNFGLLLDVWHIWHEPNVVERLQHLDVPIFGVHLGDWPTGEPRELSDRVLPGDGMIDLPVLLGAIHSAGYRGAYCLEIFSAEHLPDSLWRRDPAQVVECGREGFLRAWKAAVAQGKEKL